MRDVITKSEKLTDQQEWRLDAVDEHLVSLIDPTSFEADQYRTLRHVLEWKHPTKKVVAVTSALAGDGKTTTALNLAGALAHAPGVRVLICDLDMRTPSVGKRLGLVPQSPGLVDMVLDADLTLGDVVRRHPRFPLSVLPAGRPLTVSYELLQSSRLAELLQQTREQYDYVVVDTPPVVPVPDARLIADRVDGFATTTSTDPKTAIGIFTAKATKMSRKVRSCKLIVTPIICTLFVKKCVEKYCILAVVPPPVK